MRLRVYKEMYPSVSVRFLTLRHFRWQIVRLLSTDMHPVEIIVQVLVVVTGPRTIIECASSQRRNLLLVYLKAETFQESSRGVSLEPTSTALPTQPCTTVHRLAFTKLKPANSSPISVSLSLVKTSLLHTTNFPQEHLLSEQIIA